MTTIKNLLLALLNATIMLLIILAVAGIVLLGRVEHLAEEVHHELAAPLEQVERIADGIEGIEAELAEPGGPAELAAIAAEVTLLRQELHGVTEKLAALGDVSADVLVTEIGETIAARLAATPPASP